MAESPGDIHVEVVYAEHGGAWSRRLRLPATTTVRQAVEASGFVVDRPDVRVADDMLGVFGRRVKPEHALHDGDRVEIYRPLALDPMEARRRRAQDD